MVTNFATLSGGPRPCVKSPLVTDKSTQLLSRTSKPNQQAQYSFLVDRLATKPKIKAEIEALFQVQVVQVRTCRLPRKPKRVGKFLGWKPQYKKAMVSLAKGNQIKLFDDV